MLPVRFFATIFGTVRRGYVCIATKKKDKFQEVYFQWPNQANDMQEYVEKQKYSGNVYFCPQLLGEPKREKVNVETTTCAWADLDRCHPRNMLVTPTITLQTSPSRYQAFWSFDEAKDPTEGESIARRIAYYHSDEGADRSGWDLTQLLRIPGTRNFKYGEGAQAPKVEILDEFSELDARYRLSDFDIYPEAEGYEYLTVPMPEIMHEDGLVIVARFDGRLSGAAVSLFSDATVQDRSEALFRLEMLCFEAGMDDVEVFQVARDSVLNKWRGREDLLWRDVCRAKSNHEANLRAGLAPPPVRDEPPIVSDMERKEIEGLTTFVERYIAWARTLGDAAPQYHQASAFILLSCSLAGSVVLPTSFGTIFTNMWFMILADSTITRKAQPLDARILMSSGWKLMKDVQIGDSVIGQNGRPTKVLGLSPRTIEEVYKVTFSDGASTECTADHLWQVHNPGGNNKRVWPLSRIMRSKLQYSSGRWNFQIPAVEPVQLQEVNLPIDPYLMGLLLGDGSYVCGGVVQFSNIDTEILDAVRIELQKRNLHLKFIAGSKCSYRIANYDKPEDAYMYTNYVMQTLRKYRLYGKRGWEKSVPADYLSGSVEQRLALLQGLMDTDGWTRNNSTNFSSSSKQLALDVQYLVRSLGGWSHYDGGHPTHYKKSNGDRVECRIAHQVSVAMPLGVTPFRLTRKSERLSNRSWARPRSIRKIESVGMKEVQCIKVGSRDGLYVTDDFIVTHNSSAMNIAVDMIEEIDESLIMATDGSIEGLTSTLAARPGKVSFFPRDEFTGLMEQISKKDYMAGMPEFFTHLYDGRTQIRKLRKEEFKIKDPRFILYTGGILSRMQALTTHEHVFSGFLPRFVFITAKTDPTKIKPLGPPTERNWGARDAVKNELVSIRNHYTVTSPVMVNGTAVGVSNKIFEATLTREAWSRFNQIDQTLTTIAADAGDFRDLLLPTYARLSFSILKAAVLLAASRQREDTLVVEEQDIVHAAYYGEAWRRYAQQMVTNVGKSDTERKITLVGNAIHRVGHIQRSILMQRYHLTSSETNQLIRTLVERGEINVEQHGKQQTFRSLLSETEKVIRISKGQKK